MFSRTVFDKVGIFDDRIEIAIDADLLLRCYRCGSEFKKISTYSYYETGGLSDRRFLHAQKEFYQALHTHLNVSLVFCKIMPVLLSTIRHVVKLKSFAYELVAPFKHLYFRLRNFFLSFIPAPIVKRWVMSLLGANIDKRSCIAAGITFTELKGLRVGSNVVINTNCYIDARGGLTIGNNVNIMRDVKIYTAGHRISSPLFEMTRQETKVGDNAVIFAGAIIVPGVNIGAGAIILPGSVVSQDIPGNEIWGGNPARLIRKNSTKFFYNNSYNQVYGL